jgi:K+-transporting ATPase KdpF subunit
MEPVTVVAALVVLALFLYLLVALLQPERFG